jgi:hypothetical protein
MSRSKNKDAKMKKTWFLLSRDKKGFHACLKYWSVRIMLIIILGIAVGFVINKNIKIPPSAMIAKSLNDINLKNEEQDFRLDNLDGKIDDQNQLLKYHQKRLEKLESE